MREENLTSTIKRKWRTKIEAFGREIVNWFIKKCKRKGNGNGTLNEHAEKIGMQMEILLCIRREEERERGPRYHKKNITHLRNVRRKGESRRKEMLTKWWRRGKYKKEIWNRNIVLSSLFVVFLMTFQ